MKRPLDPLTADTRPFNTAILPSLAFLILVSFLFSCSKTSLPDQDGFVQYTIPAGEHYSLENGLKRVEGKVMRFEVKFNQSAAYTTQKPENQFDINKLYGFSDCGAQHHVNSARVGWRWNGQEVELFAYCYANKVNKSVLLGKMKIDEAKTVAISVQSREYIFELDGKTVKMERHCDTETFQGYQLYPYFGGDETSPHEITILIRNLDTGGGKS